MPVLCRKKFCTAFRARGATALLLQTVFNFVAIMRHHAALCKQITSVLRAKRSDDVDSAQSAAAFRTLAGDSARLNRACLCME